MDETVAMYRQLDSREIIETVRTLQGRIEGRFPGSGLGKVVTELLRVAEETVTRTQWIQKPHLLLRFAAVVLSVAVIALAILMLMNIHQLTKHPESCFARTQNTTLHTRRMLTPFELNRYLDYCSDTLALISKIAALYVQGYQDTVVLGAVDDVEDLTAGLSRKIWQKLTILESLGQALPSGESLE